MTKPQADLRLTLPLVCVWSGSLTAFGFVSSSGWLNVIAVSVVIGVLVFARQRRMVGLAISLLIVVVMSVWLRWSLLHNDTAQSVLESSPVGDVVFMPSSDPMVVDAVGFQALSFASETRFRAETISIDGRHVRLPVYVTTTEVLHHVDIGSVWTCSASVRVAEGAVNFLAYVRCRSTLKRLDEAPLYQQWASAVRAGLAEVSSKSHRGIDGAALLPGLVLGDTSAQRPELENALRIAGLGHLTAVSGANVAIVVGGVGLILSLTALSRRSRFLVLASTVIAFMIVVRPSASVVRASAMALIGLVVWLVGRRKHAETIIFSSAILLLLIDPWLSLSWGFALSVAATLGLVLLPPLWGVDQSTALWKRVLITASAAAVATTPVLVVMGAAPTLGTIPANVLADAFVAPATIAGVSAALLKLAHLDFAAELFADFGIAMAQAIVFIARTVSDSPLATSLLSWQAAVLALGIAVGWHQRANRARLVWIASFGLAAILVGSQSWAGGWPVADWELLVCDVGQGDAALVRTGSQSAIVIDSGGEAELIDSCLDKAGVRTVTLFIASHFHQDHVGGFSGVVRGRIVQRVITSAFAQPPMGAQLIRENVSVPVESAYVGMSGDAPGVSWQVLLANKPEIAGSAEVDGTTINSSSVVLLVHTRHWKILFTGDIEIAAQQELMERVGHVNVDLVKIAHHGSRFQAEAFAEWVGAEAAWASVGVGNPYRHPNQATLNRFRRAGARVATTMDCGAIAATARHTLATERRCIVA